MTAFAAIPIARWVQPSPWIGKVARASVLIVFGLGIAAVALDDVHMHRAQPGDSAAAHQYIDGAVHNDAARMWETYSPRAQQARGGDRVAYVAYMRIGTHPQTEEPNAYRLVARVPLNDGGALLYYQVDISTAARGQHVLFPVVVNAQGLVDDAASDGVSFVPPRPRTATP